MDIKLSEINSFSSLNDFSYKENKTTSYYSNKGGFFSNRPVIALNKKNEIVIHFQNIFERLFSPIIEFILTKLHIAHTCTDSKRIWEAFKKIELIRENESFPAKKNKQQILQLLVEKVSQFVKKETFYVNIEANKIGVQDFQKMVLYLDENEISKAKKMIDSLKQLNAHFDKAMDTPLTLAIKKENLEIITYLLAKKDENGKPAIDPNKATIDGQTPLLITAKKDLPRKYFVALFDAGALPQNQAEMNMMTKLAGDNKKLINALKELMRGKPYSWPTPVAFRDIERPGS